MGTVGMAPVEALRSRLPTGAGRLEVADHVGRIEPGFRTDLVGVVGDPLIDIWALHRVGRRRLTRAG